MGLEPSDFVAPPLLRNRHWMTLWASLRPRRFPALPRAETRLVQVTPDTRLRLDCHWQKVRAVRPTLLLVHGLEGSSECTTCRGRLRRPGVPASTRCA